MALGSTQPPSENEYQEHFLGVREADNLAIFMCGMSRKSGSLNLLEPSGPHRDCYRTALLWESLKSIKMTVGQWEWQPVEQQIVTAWTERWKCKGSKCQRTYSLWIKPTDALNSNFVVFTTLHVSGSLSARHQEFLAVHRLWYILYSCDEPFATRSRMELLAVPSYSW